MNIIINNDIRNKYNKGFPRPGLPNEIVIHATGGGKSAADLIKWMMGGERAHEYYGGIALFHYLNDYDGNVTEIIDPDRWIYHSSSGTHDSETIGIENMSPAADNSYGFTEQQYQSLFELILSLLEKYPINSIAGHNFNTIKFSGQQYVKVPCPGNFNWNRLADFLSLNGYSFGYEDQHFYNIKLI